MNEKDIPLANNSSPFHLLSFVLAGAAFGLSYGMFTMSGEILAGCIRNPEGFCGVIGGLLNIPGTLLATFLIPKESLYSGVLHLITILAIDMIIGSIVGYFAIKTYKTHVLRKFVLAIFAISIVLALPFILFIFLAS